MAVEALTEFPASFVSGDMLRVDISDADHPATLWSLKVLFEGPTRKNFTATVDGSDFELSADTANMLVAGTYTVTYVFTETSSNERASVAVGKVEVLPDPEKAAAKTIAAETLAAMESALKKLAGGSNLTVSFNGQSFTKKNLKELQDAIAVQRDVVDSETSTSDLASGVKRRTGIFTRFA